MEKFSVKRFSNTKARLFRDHLTDQRLDRLEQEIELDAERAKKKYKKDKRALKRAERKDKNGYHSLEHEAMRDSLKHQKFEAELNERLAKRKLARLAEKKDIKRARSLEDANGGGNNLKRKFQDTKLNAKYKLQDLSDNYFEKTEGRSLAGDAALATAGIGVGYLTYKAIKKAKYDKKKAQEQAENKFKKD